ncbi:hypothetical protein [Streptomyces sp. NPDC127190]|uniref:hypothetical protein n=1 Tax=unclassified Streptomyces TaxID=2593676 RepID=UPI00362A671A
MPAHASTLLLFGVTVLAVTAVVWAAVLTRLVRRAGHRAAARRVTPPLPALPRQSPVGPPQESVELTPAEQAAFAGLIRRLANG